MEAIEASVSSTLTQIVRFLNEGLTKQNWVATVLNHRLCQQLLNAKFYCRYFLQRTLSKVNMFSEKVFVVCFKQVLLS